MPRGKMLETNRKPSHNIPVVYSFSNLMEIRSRRRRVETGKFTHLTIETATALSQFVREDLYKT